MWTYRAALVRVVDADTVVLNCDLGFYQHRLARSYRLARINAPELNTEAGKAAKAALEGHLAGAASFMVTTSRADSFDRWIVELYADGQNISDYLVANGHAVYQAYR